jgi:hypothetical protein
MQPSSDPELSHPDRAMTDGVSGALHPTVRAAELAQSPDRVADLVTRMVELLVEVYGQPMGDVPYTAGDDPRLRAAITRLQRLEGSVEEPARQAKSVHQLRPSVPSADSCDRGEWVAAGARR